MRAMSNIELLLVILILLGGLAILLSMFNSLIRSAPHVQSNSSFSTTLLPVTSVGTSNNTNTTNITLSDSTTSIGEIENYSSPNSYTAYTLNLINQERSAAGLQNVTLSPIQSGQQHSDSMLTGNYFSHWDPYGLKPYMRYTLLNGTEEVDENVAINEEINKSCNSFTCTLNPINVTRAISNMEYQMLYNDSACCNNGHRVNILDPNHNQISIGVAYNKTTVYLTEDFINNYIRWNNNTPLVFGNTVRISGTITGENNFSLVQINYDPTPQNMTNTQLAQTGSYNAGTTVAGVAYGSYYYQNIDTIYATIHSFQRNNFDLQFNLSSAFQLDGPGVYTIEVYLTNSIGSQFLGTTYSVFLNSNGTSYLPNNV